VIAHNRSAEVRACWAACLLGLGLSTLVGCNNFSASTRNSEGVRLYQQARYREALQHFQEASYAEPKNPDSYYNIAATYHRIGIMENRASDLVQAEDYYNRCLDRDGNHADCYRALAVLLVEQGRYDEAFRLLEGWVDREPTSADAKIELARLFEEFNDRRSAKKYLIEALALDTENPRARAALGKIREDMGEYAQALANYQQSYAKNQFQPDLANRIAALRSQVNPSAAANAPQAGTRVVEQNGSSLR